MSIKFCIRFKQTMLLSLGLVSGLFSTHILASKGGELADKTKVVVLKPDQLPNIKGTRISSYSLAAVHGGRMNPIPYQFDERTTQGYIFIKGLDKKYHQEDPILGEEGYFDGNDELLFMLKDAGPRKRDGMATDGKIISEIELSTYNNQKVYVYLIEKARLESENAYVRYSSALGRVETDYYALKVDPNNAFMWQEFYYDSFDGAHPRQPVDTIKLYLNSRPLGGIPLTINNKHTVARALAEKAGPIRVTTEYKLNIVYLKAPLLNIKLQIVYHEHEISYQAQLDIPQVRRRLIARPILRLSLDGYDLHGASVRAQGGPKEAGIVDGQISEIEKQLQETQLKQNEKSWLWMDSHYGFMLLSNFSLQTESDEEIPISIFYNDDAEAMDKPEYHKGHLPNAGFEIRHIPLKGLFKLQIDLLMYNDRLDIQVEDFVDMVNRQPAIKVFNL